MFTVIDKPSGVDENGRSRPFAALVDYIQEQVSGALAPDFTPQVGCSLHLAVLLFDSRAIPPELAA
eukprot:364197-Chlamydomonas_euryale.AAC.12